MNRPTAPHQMIQAPMPTGPHAGYMPGFGNDFETEALPGALPGARPCPVPAPARCPPKIKKPKT